MGLLALQRLMSCRRNQQRSHRKIRVRMGKRKGSPCQQDEDGHGDSRAANRTRTRCSIPALPEDILHHIHSLLSMHDAARAACVSHAFQRFWRCHPVLTLNREILGSNGNVHQENLIRKTDHILRNHSGVGIKIFELKLFGAPDACHYMNSWLQIAVAPGIEELTLNVCAGDEIEYNFPCTLFSDGVRNSIRRLQLSYCVFRPIAELGPLRNLKSLCLHYVCISGDELECFLSNSPALEQLDLTGCEEILRLKIPRVLLQLCCLNVSYCIKLRVIESNARNLSSLIVTRGDMVKVSLGETLQMKNLCMRRSDLICYARTQLPSSMPNLETLTIGSSYERVNTPMLPTKFLFLKCLNISLFSGGIFPPSYDYFSLVSFLNASPSLETLFLDVSQESMEHESVFGASSQLREIPEHHHGNLKSVKIKGFSSAKSLVELTCYILKNAEPLERLTLDTTYGDPKCDNELSGGRCARMNKDFLMEARRGAVAIRTYIEDKVPPAVKLTVIEHCKRRHADKLSQ